VLGAQLVLPVIYLSSAMVRAFVRRSSFSLFEAAQIGTAFILAVAGGLRLGGIGAVAALCLSCAAACYAAGSVLKSRNSQLFQAFGFLLVVTGSCIAIPAGWASAAWAGLAVAFLFFDRPAFRWQGAGYLLFALVVSGVLEEATHALLAESDPVPSIAPLLEATVVALACVRLSVRAKQRGLQIFLAAIAFWLSAAVAATAFAGSYHAVFGLLASHGYCAAGRTLVLAGGALLLAWAGARWNAAEIATPLIYPIMALGAYRLLLIDLRQDSKAALVISLLSYGTALVLIPRSRRPRQITPS
jgi:hypothetical protein